MSIQITFKTAKDIKKYSEFILSSQSKRGNTLEKFVEKLLDDKYKINFEKTRITSELIKTIKQTKQAIKFIQPKIEKRGLDLGTFDPDDNWIFLYELKIGSQFDSEKIEVIVDKIQEANRIPSVKASIICWDEEQLCKVRKDAKNHTISGIEFCNRYNFDYYLINELLDDWYFEKFTQFYDGDRRWHENDFFHYLSGRVEKEEKLAKFQNICPSNLSGIWNPS